MTAGGIRRACRRASITRGLHGSQGSGIGMQQVPQHRRDDRAGRARGGGRGRHREGREPGGHPAVRRPGDTGGRDRWAGRAQRRTAVACGGAELAAPRNAWLPASTDAASVLHRQGRCRQDLAVDGRRAVAGGCRQAGAAGQHRCRIEPGRDAGDRAAQHTHNGTGRARPVGAEHRSGHGCRVVSAAGHRADGRRLQRHRPGDRARAAVGRLHHRDRLVRRVRVAAVRRR